ncbi:putative 3-hydroxyacyl-CoA dehydrogenase [Aspergillus affinis]|uniref:putative 3-hydroxyacyl-CoA dehydrogenase n=1 Tax=Aspergillus affinis TaxID=1070780 RepID=UPI0022FDC930|nr:NAD(P)-binding protein [Aspergillus affinis]KAI9042453.1 NAD(P)-binding protein [Aspergillus affinis]
MIAPTEPAIASNSSTPLTQFTPDVDREALLEKVIVVVGGSNGIGASLVDLCCRDGAYVVIGDIDDTGGEALSRKCVEKWPVFSDPALPPKPPRSTFQHVDVTNYQEVVDLFDRAFKKYRKIDHVVVTAGSMDTGENWFDQKLSLVSVRQPPSTKDLDVNLIGSMYVTRVASVYLRHNRGPGVDRSILLFSCAAGFKETAGVSSYQAAKHGVQGLMRSLRPYFPSPYKHNLRINTICPWMTDSRTLLTKKVHDRWLKEGLPVSTPQEVAEVSASVLADDSLNGTSMYVEGGRAWEIEANLDRLECEWLGEEPSRVLARGQKVLHEAWAA